ncbi:Phospholipase_B [Hexamita inflata]|uniref:Phospholipase B-like n=1 Tax=Hexamita inflata TaxID=28002 RepID=A0ABP1HYX2_9EUKA
MMLSQLVIATAAQNVSAYFVLNADNSVQQQTKFNGAHIKVSYNGDKDKVGFKELHLTMINSGLTNNQQMFLSGYAEAFISANEIEDYKVNAYSDEDLTNPKDETDTYPTKAFQTYVNKQLAYFESMINKKDKTDFEQNYWGSVDLTLSWLKGMAAGYNKAKNTQMTFKDFYYMNSIPDYDSLLEKFYPEVTSRDQTPTHCSGIVYPTPDCKDIYFSQVTWTGFQAGFNRILKSYNLKLNLLTTKEQSISFSSYPAQFFSLDDFYIVKNTRADKSVTSMSILETTFNNFKPENTEKMVEESTLTWMRCMLANLNTASAQDWVDFFTHNISLTYNNNYLLVDYALFESIKAANPKATTQELKQLLSDSKILTTVEIADKENTYTATVSKQLYEQNYYASLNSPVSDQVHNFYGYTADPYFDYNGSARLCQVKKVLGQAKITDFTQFKAFMRSNNFITDPTGCQHNDPREGIASRYDLCKYNNEIHCKQQSGEIRDPRPFGATDAKVTNTLLVQNSQYEFVFGPTLGSDKVKFPKLDFKTFNMDVRGVPQILPLTDEDVFFTITNEKCKMRDNNCQKCAVGTEEKEGTCQSVSNTGIICALVIPFGILIVVSLGFIAFIFLKKQNSYKELKEVNGSEDVV